MAVSGVVVDHREVARRAGLHEAVDEGVDQLDGRAGAAEAPDHHRGIVADIGHRLRGCGDRLVHVRSLLRPGRRALPIPDA